MNILTYSVVVGTAKCNVRCPFCVAVMTPHYPKLEKINSINLKKGARLSVRGGATTLLLTGKGEPTLYPEQITQILKEVGDEFPIIELQTNGVAIARGHLDNRSENHLLDVGGSYLQEWKALGLTTIALSCVHWDNKVNGLMHPQEGEMPDLAELVSKIKGLGFTVRLSVVMVKGGIDSVEKFAEFINWARKNKVDQMTLRPVTRPEDADGKISDWVSKNYVTETLTYQCLEYLEQNGSHLLDLAHGASVFDVNGQNVCLTNCLTLDKTGEQIRQLIYCTDGHIRYDWRYEGAILF